LAIYFLHVAYLLWPLSTKCEAQTKIERLDKAVETPDAATIPAAAEV
jgi:hypothetical protein